MTSISAALNARLAVSPTLLCKKMHISVEENLLNELQNGQAQNYSAEQTKILRKERKYSSPRPVQPMLGFPPKQSVQVELGSGKKVLTLDSNREIQVPWENMPVQQKTDIEAVGAWSKGFDRVWAVFQEIGAFRYPASQSILWFVKNTHAEPLNIGEKTLTSAQTTKSFERMEKRGCNPEMAALNTFLHVLCISHETGQAEALLRLVKSKLKPNKMSFGILINGWCKAGKIYRALNVLKWMGAVHCLDVVAYNTVLDALCRANEFGLAIRLLKKMAKNGCVPDVVTYNILIHRSCKAKNLEMALKVYRLMKEQGSVAPNEATYSPLIISLCNVGILWYAHELLDKMRESGFSAGIAVYNSFVKYFCKNRQMERALVFLGEMKESGCEPNRETYHLLIRRLLLENKLEKAWVLWKEMRLGGYNADVDTYVFLIKAFCCRGEFQNACDLLEEMVREGVAPQNHHTWNTFCAKCIKAGDVESLDRLKQLMDTQSYLQVT